MSKLQLEVVGGMDRVDAAAWDALTPPDDPFSTHVFLSALEDSGSACAETGWAPAHLLAREQGRLMGAVPAWVKSHSYGEYVFDWGWAQASQRAGLPYYPKLVSAVPFTPSGAGRLLVHPSANGKAVRAALLAGLRALADEARCWSVHALLVTEEEWKAAESAGWICRVTQQFHWENIGYSDFDDWLSRFRSKVRKETRRERRRPGELGATVHVLRGENLESQHWHALEDFYRSTCSKKRGEAYLTPDFFELAQHRLAHSAVGILAEVDGRWVAGALAFHRGQALYGRYWGCKEGFERLHFEICYHRPIELCITEGWSRFEAGAQGGHKLRRGLMPAPIRSAHWLRHPGLAEAVADAVGREKEAVETDLVMLGHHGPFRRG